MDFPQDPSSDYGRLAYPYASGLSEEITTFKKMDIPQWTSENCVDWAVSVCKKKKFFQESAKTFGQVSGQELLQYTEQDFCLLTNTIEGPIFYKEFCKLRQKRSNRSSQPQDSIPSLDQLQTSFSSSDLLPSMEDYLRDATQDKGELFFPESSWQAHQYEDDLYSHSDLNPYGNTLSSDPYCGSYPSTSSAYPSYPVDASGPSCSSSYGSSGPGDLSEPSKSTGAFARIKSKKRPNRERNPTILEVLMRLLEHTATNPKVIKWQDQERGVFRIVDKDFVVRLWGTRGGKVAEKESEDLARLTESFERTMRHHYGKELKKEDRDLYVFTPAFLLKYRAMQNQSSTTGSN